MSFAHLLYICISLTLLPYAYLHLLLDSHSCVSFAEMSGGFLSFMKPLDDYDDLYPNDDLEMFVNP